MKFPRRTILRIALGIVGLYFGTYAILSVTGGYVLTQSGSVRYKGPGISVSDIFQWQPRFAFCQRFRQTTGAQILRADKLGYLFAPLILLDQAYVHRTIRLFDAETGEVIEHPVKGTP